MNERKTKRTMDDDRPERREFRQDRQPREVSYRFFTRRGRELHGIESRDLRLGDTVYTPNGVGLVSEIFWDTHWDARVILVRQ